MPELIERVAGQAEDGWATPADTQQPVTQYCAVAIFRYKNRRVRRREVEDRWPADMLQCLPQPRRSASAWSRDAVIRTARYVANMLELSGDISVTEVDGVLCANVFDVNADALRTLFTIPEGGNPTPLRRDIDSRVLTSMYEASVGISTDADYFTAYQVQTALRGYANRYRHGVEAFGSVYVDPDNTGHAQDLLYYDEVAWIVPAAHYHDANALLSDCASMRVIDRHPRWVPLTITPSLADEIVRHLGYQRVYVSRRFHRWPRTSSRARRVAFAAEHEIAMAGVANMASHWGGMFAAGGLHPARRDAEQLASDCRAAIQNLRTALRLPLF